MVLGALLLPALASSATSDRIIPSFVGGTPGAGTSLHLRLVAPYHAEPQTVTAVVHLPKGTVLNLGRLPRADLCPYYKLSYGISACPKASRVGVGSATLEAIIGGQPTIVKAPLQAVLTPSHGITEVDLLIEAPPPFGIQGESLWPYKDIAGFAAQELIVGYGDREVSIGLWSRLTELSVTFGANLKTGHGTSSLITMPPRCPTRGFAWRTDFPFASPAALFPTTTPCLGRKARVSRSRFAAPVAVASTPKTQFQCEKTFHITRGRKRCFNQLPGASCAHPLEAEKAGPTTRGEHWHFKLGFDEEVEAQGTPQYGTEQHYSYASGPNVRMCPYPIGAVYKVSLVSQKEHRGPNAKGQEECSSEYDTHNYPEPVSPSGGSFSYYMTNVPLKSWYLVVKGYFLHPPWAGRGHAARAAATSTLPPQCKKYPSGERDARAAVGSGATRTATDRGLPAQSPRAGAPASGGGKCGEPGYRDVGLVNPQQPCSTWHRSSPRGIRVWHTLLFRKGRG